MKNKTVFFAPTCFWINLLFSKFSKYSLQQTTLQNRELMEGFQDDRPNGEFSSSSSEEVSNNHPYQATTSSKGHSSQATTSASKPNLVNGYSSKTYHNGFHGRYRKPVVRKRIPSRDYFEDSDSYPKLVTPGEGEPDICDDVEYCDSYRDEDQTHGGAPASVGVVEGEGDDGDFVKEIGVRGNGHHSHSRFDDDTDSSIEDNSDRKTALHSHSQGASLATAQENSKEIHDSIVTSSHISVQNEPPHKGQNGATPKVDINLKPLNTENSDMVAQELDMDTHKDDELMISISGSGRISLVATDENKKSPHKGNYVGPVVQKTPQSDAGFSDQKTRFEALRKKFSEPGSFSKSKSDSDSEDDQQKKGDNSQSMVVKRQVERVQVPLSVRTNRNSREEEHVAPQGERHSQQRVRCFEEFYPTLSVADPEICPGGGGWR